MNLFEGGNVYDNTEPVAREDVPTVVDVVRRELPGDLAKQLMADIGSAGFKVDFSEAGLYIWCTRNEDSWKSVEWLSELGVLATPGTFYGPAGAKHIRVALTSTDEKISEAANRISSAK